MSQLTIRCPNCDTDFELTETLAGPAIAEMRVQVQLEAKQREKELAEREEGLARLEGELSKRQATFDAEIEKRLSTERKALIAEAKKEATTDIAGELDELKKELQSEKDKRKEAERAELQIRNQAKKLQEEKEGWELEKQRILAAERDTMRADVQKSLGAEYDLKIKEREKTIADMEAKLKEAQRKASQGSQQLQGEVLELDFEESLRLRFPWDEIEEVKKGQRGADVVQRVCSAPGLSAGVILWEAKRAEKWGNDWAQKAKQDARDAKADVTVIVTKSLPKGIELFGEVDGVWVCDPSVALLLASVLRNGVLQIAAMKRSGSGAQTKAERLYEYMSSTKFASWLEGIAEPFVQMQSDLVSEKRSTFARWKKREKCIDRVMESVAGLSGDLEAISGGDLKALPGFSDDESECEASDEE